MNQPTFPLNSREYHKYNASRCAALAILYTGSDADYVAAQAAQSNYHAAQALTALPAQAIAQQFAR